MDLDETMFTPTNGYPNTYVIDEDYPNDVEAAWQAPIGVTPGGNEWRTYTKQTELAAVATNPGSFYWVPGEKLYLHTFESSHPTNVQIAFPERNHTFLVHTNESFVSISGFRFKHNRGDGVFM